MPTGDPLYDSLISGYTSTMDQQPDETTLLNTILQRYMDPQQQERLKKLRETTPEQINRANMQEYYGKGKLGTVMQILTGIVGTPQPNWHKLATERWNQNQALAQQQETNANTLAKSELQGVLAGRKNAADAMKAALAARSKEQLSQQQIASREKLASNLDQLKRDIEQGRLTQAQAQAQWKQYIDEENLKLNKIKGTLSGNDIGSELGRIMASGDPELMKTIPIVVGGKQAEMEARSARPGSPEVVRQFQTERLDPKSNMMIQTRGTNRTPEKPPIGPQHAISDWFRNMQEGQVPTNSIGQPIVPVEKSQPESTIPPRSQPLAQRRVEEVLTGKSSSPVIFTATLDNTGNPKTNMSARATPPAPLPTPGPAIELRTGSSPTGADKRVRAYYRPPENAKAVGLPREDAKVMADKEAKREMAGGAEKLSTIFEQAFLSGSLDDRFNWKNRLLELAKAGLPGTVVRAGNTGDQTLEVMVNQITGEVANYLKYISGAQVSDAEFKRNVNMFANWSDNPEQLIKQAYSRAATYRALQYFDSLHIPITTELMSKITDNVIKDTNDYYGFLSEKRQYPTKDLSQTRGARERLLDDPLKDLKNGERVAVMALQEAYPDNKGGYVTYPYHNPNVFGATLDVYIPHSWKGAKTPQKEMNQLQKVIEDKKRKDAQRRNILLDPDMIKAQKALPRF